MKPIQFILVPVLIFLLFFFWRRLSSVPVLKWLVSLLLCLGIYFVVDLDSSTRVANLLGIGRGVDLVMYLSLLGLGVGWILLYLRIRKLERKLTEVVRNVSLMKKESDHIT